MHFLFLNEYLVWNYIGFTGNLVECSVQRSTGTKWCECKPCSIKHSMKWTLCNPKQLHVSGNLASNPIKYKDSIKSSGGARGGGGGAAPPPVFFSFFFPLFLFLFCLSSQRSVMAMIVPLPHYEICVENFLKSEKKNERLFQGWRKI